MSDKKKLMIAIVSVLLIVVLVGGATFAYWSWQTNTTERTNVSFTILDASASGDMSASIEGNGTLEVTSLVPTDNCAGSNALVKEVIISYKNNTDNGAKITANLSLTNLTAGATAIDYTRLSYLKWAITTTEGSCTDGEIDSGDFSDFSLSANTVYPVSVTTIENTVGTTTDLAEEIELERYYLYVWLDYNYDHINYGSDNNDPMQNLSFTLQWSGTMEQTG